jgi:hypothetical protein
MENDTVPVISFPRHLHRDEYIIVVLAIRVSHFHYRTLILYNLSLLVVKETRYLKQSGDINIVRNKVFLLCYVVIIVVRTNENSYFSYNLLAGSHYRLYLALLDTSIASNWRLL